MDMLRVFVKWLESIDAGEKDHHTKVLSPTLTRDDNICDEKLDIDQAEQTRYYDELSFYYLHLKSNPF